MNAHSVPHANPSFRLPSLPRFHPAHRRPDIDEREMRCRTWLSDNLREAYRDDTEEFDRFLDQRTTLWTLLSYATGRPDRVETVCNWINVLFSVDDLFVHTEPARMRRLGLNHLHALINSHPVTADTPHLQALATLAQRIRSDMSVGLWDRFAHTTARFLDACRTERHWRDTGTLVDLPTYEDSRVQSVGECCFPLLEYALGIDLTRARADHPGLHRLDVLVARHWIGVNDIFSYRKEFHGGDTTNEVVLALADNGGDLQAAVDRVADTVRAVEEEFTALCPQLSGAGADRNPDLPRYVEALRWMIAGNLEWSYITTRYNGTGHVWDGSTEAVVTLTPHRMIYSPAPQEQHPPQGAGAPPR